MPTASNPTPRLLVTASHRTSALLPFSCGFEYSVHWASTVPLWRPTRASLRSAYVSSGPGPNHATRSKPAGMAICMPNRGSIGSESSPGVNAAST